MMRNLGMCALCASAWLFYGCGGGEQKPTAPAPPAAASEAIPPALSINAEMVGLVDHAAHELWNVERQETAPKTDADWEELEHHAMQLAAGGSLITLGGTGPADAGWAQSPNWRSYARKLIDVATREAAAARSKDREAMIKANGELVEVCDGCHKEFKPPLPTEGLVHPHYRK